ncbi:MAG: hypothetical protein M1817_001695 [Caeruleum heppii]|nr:MAG: hypothetical protein M1817_001695 [Caeruleum heppii]
MLELSAVPVGGFALYRALVSKCPYAPIPPAQRQSLRALIKKSFWRNRYVQSSSRLIPALQAGYEVGTPQQHGPELLADSTIQANELLESAISGSSGSTSAILKLLARLDIPELPKDPPLPAKSTDSSTRPASRQPQPRQTIASKLDRSYPTPTGRRSIPILVNANGNPMIRLKKPQPHTLSRVLRYKVKQKNRRFHWLEVLEEQLASAILEQVWDEQLVALAGLTPSFPAPSMSGRDRQANTALRGEPTWPAAVEQSMQKINNDLRMEQIAKSARAAQKQAVVERAMSLAAKAKADRRVQKTAERRARALTRQDHQ